MELLIVYDVATSTPSGDLRLRRVAKVCEAHGQRVQKSVFECVLNEGQAEVLWHKLLLEIDVEVDSLRMYRLREPSKRFLYLAGRKPEFDIRDPLVL